MAPQWWKALGSTNLEKLIIVIALVQSTEKAAYVVTGLAGDISRDSKRPFRNLTARVRDWQFFPVIDDVPTDTPQPRYYRPEHFRNWSRVFGHRRDEPDVYDVALDSITSCPSRATMSNVYYANN